LDRAVPLASRQAGFSLRGAISSIELFPTIASAAGRLPEHPLTVFDLSSGTSKAIFTLSVNPVLALSSLQATKVGSRLVRIREGDSSSSKRLLKMAEFHLLQSRDRCR